MNHPLNSTRPGNRIRIPFTLALVLASSIPLAATDAPPFTAYAGAEAGSIVVSHAERELLRIAPAVWGPNWAWTGFEGQARSDRGVAAATLVAKVGNTPLRLDFRATHPSPNRLELDYELKVDQDASLTMFILQLAPGDAFKGHEIAIESAGRQSTARVPLGRRPLGDQVTGLRWPDVGGGSIQMRFDPPCETAADGAVRLVLAKDRLAAGVARHVTITVELPGPAAWHASPDEIPNEPGIEGWYPWQAKGDAADSVISMADWLEKPAGKHGRLLRAGDRLTYHGRPIKLWGLNLCYGACAPDKAMADQRAGFYPRYGINAVRLHKFADGTGWSGIQSKDSAAEYDAAGLDRMDYQVAKFKEAGIYVKLSAHFGTLKLGRADARDVPFLEEFGAFNARRDRIEAPHSAFFYAPELQNLQIRQMANLLKHTNAYTGQTYAADPVICAVEIINEQSVFFFTSMAPLKQSATLRRQIGERFGRWLEAKYGNHDGLVKAWGTAALDAFIKDGFPAGERLDRRNILPLGNPWYWDPAQLAGSQAARRQRLLDTLHFLYELQCEAYDRYVAALREAGYAGEILGSNWQAGRAVSHYANLHTDARVGLIDRHNYFGGGRGGPGPFNAASMLARAGSGLLSSGLQQVDDRPFMLSEWIHVFPNEWGVEGPALIGAYGLGLQGWDVSFLFQNGDNAAFSPRLGGQPWDVMAPQILASFPAVARQVLRGDVREADVLAVRHVHVPSLFEGRLGFEDQVTQGYDDKELDTSAVPARALAAARCVVTFTEQFQETPRFDLRRFQLDDVIVASTGQLRWQEGQERASGYFSINTDGTKAVVGFAAGRTCALEGVAITPQSRFAAIYVTAPEPDGNIATSRRLLVTALARARNTGMRFSPDGNELLERGTGPVLMEPVKATIAIPGRGVREVRLLDHDGRRTAHTRPVAGGEFTLDGAMDRTPYYEVTVE